MSQRVKPVGLFVWAASAVGIGWFSSAAVGWTSQAPTLAVVSVNSAGTPASDHCWYPALSENGERIAFESDASQLVPSDTNAAKDIFVRDVATSSTVRVSVNSLGGQADGASALPSISSDGRFVVFQSDARQLVPLDRNQTTDVFRHDLLLGVTERVSLGGTAIEGDGPSGGASISQDGRFVAFHSDSTNLVSGDTNGKRDVFVRDMVARSTVRVSVQSSGAEAGQGAVNGSISADGSSVAFKSRSNDLSPIDGFGTWDVYVRDLQAGTTSLVSVNSQGEGANADCHGVPAISADGRFVAFTCLASNLVALDRNGVNDVFVHDRTLGVTVRASVNSAGGEARARCEVPGISGDGTRVVFQSPAPNLVQGDHQGTMDIFVHDLNTGDTVRVSEPLAGARADGSTTTPAISGDGAYVAFSSDSTKLIQGPARAGQPYLIYRFGPLP